MLLTSLRFLRQGQAFPPASERKRLERYRNNRLLFEGEHALVYREAFRRIERVIGNFEEVISYGVIFNYQKLMSLKTADFVCASPPRITVADDAKQKLIDKILQETDFYRKLYCSVLDISRYGDSVFQVSKGKDSKPELTVISPKYWFPVVDGDNIRKFAYHVFAWRYIINADRKQYGLAVQIHKPDEPGVCECHRYELRGQKGSFSVGKELTRKKEISLETEMNVCPVFVVSNVPTSDNPFGQDDYDSVDSIISELCVRVSQIEKVLDKFSNPTMAGSANLLERDEITGEYHFRYGNFVPLVDGDAPPEMIVWNADMEANFKMIELLINQLYALSEMGSAAFGDLSHSAGNVTSGSALRRLMISPLAKARRIAMHYEKPIREMLSLCAAVDGVTIEPQEITVQWNDGLPADPMEEANILNLRTGGKATLSRYTALRRFDGMSDSDADEELAAIEQEDASIGMGNVPVNEPESVAVDE